MNQSYIALIFIAINPWLTKNNKVGPQNLKLALLICGLFLKTHHTPCGRCSARWSPNALHFLHPTPERGLNPELQGCILMDSMLGEINISKKQDMLWNKIRGISVGQIWVWFAMMGKLWLHFAFYDLIRY